MGNNLFEHTKIVSYFIWEYTGCEHALDLWYCAEDLACYFEQMGILTEERVNAIKQLGVDDPAYIHFMRHISFRVHIYTNRYETCVNWFTGEKLMNNGEWLSALVSMASVYHREKANEGFASNVRSENIRAFYDN